MSAFNLSTVWKIPAQIENCWFSIIDLKKWPFWWKYVVNVIEIEAGDRTGVNSKYTFHWRTCLPYRINFDLQVTQIKPFQLIAFKVTGDLLGSGYCRLTPQIDHTQIQFVWNVRTQIPWMTVISTLAHPIFVWNHRIVMKSGEQSLSRRLKLIS